MNFWDRVQIEAADQCWPWKSRLDRHGYGKYSFKQNGKRSYTAASRHAYQLEHGPVPTSLCVLHTCDNRACCNPKHLYVGTNKDNTHDMLDRDRQIKPTLTAAQIEAICSRPNDSLAVLAAEYCVSKVMIARARNGWTGRAYNIKPAHIIDAHH